MTIEAPTEQISHIPNWCINIFDEEQKDPDKHEGFKVLIKVWCGAGHLLYDDHFYYVGQEKERLRGRGAGPAGAVAKTTCHWKGKEVECNSNMIGQWIDKSSLVTITISNLEYLQS